MRRTHRRLPRRRGRLISHPFVLSMLRNSMDRDREKYKVSLPFYDEVKVIFLGLCRWQHETRPARMKGRNRPFNENPRERRLSALAFKHLELGRKADLRGNKGEAGFHYQKFMDFLDEDKDARHDCKDEGE